MASVASSSLSLVASSSVSPPPDASSVCAASTGADGPVLSLIGKRLRALRKKYNRILQMEERVAQGKPLNKEQEEVLRSKTSVVLLIDEYEKLRQPLAAAVQEELSRLPPPPPPAEEPSAAAASAAAEGDDKAVDDLVTLLYFSLLFEVKQEGEFQDIMVMRNHERDRCLTYDYVTDDVTDLLGHADLDAISHLGVSITSRPANSGASHRSALQECVEHAKLWLRNANQPIQPGASLTYAGLREKLNKILSSDYCTTISGMKSAADVAAAVGKYDAACQVQISEPNAVPQVVVQAEGAQMPEDEQEDLYATVQPEATDEPSKMDEAEVLDPSADEVSAKQEQQKLETDVEENNNRDVEQKEQQYTSRRPYQNYRAGNRGGGGNGGRRGYVTGRGGRGGRVGNGGYQNGRNQYYDSGYYPRNYYNARGRGGRSANSGMYSNHHGGSHGGHAPAGVELETSA